MNHETYRPLGSSFDISLGARGEMFAWGYLTRAGYKIIEKNYRTHFGEIDVVAQKDQRLYFVEVKTRSSTDKGTPEEAVDARKQTQMARLALSYLQTKKKLEEKVSFGVLSVLWQPPAEPGVKWFENAFSLDEGYYA